MDGMLVEEVVMDGGVFSGYGVVVVVGVEWSGNLKIIGWMVLVFFLYDMFFVGF